MQIYRMRDTIRVADEATQEIVAYLESFPETIHVENVEEVAAYRAIDVDLLWLKQDGVMLWIEVKGDRYYQTGNYFFETVSNKARNTPGCFLYTEAHFVFYYFLDVRELHMLPMPSTRDWFLANLERFAERETSTPTAPDQTYITVGRLVPRDTLRTECKDIQIHRLP